MAKLPAPPCTRKIRLGMGQRQSGVLEELLGEVLRAVQSERIKEELKEWIQSSSSVNIFVTGRTGAGKSTLVNAMIGQKLAEEGGELDPMTSEVTCYETTVSGVRVKVWDSPGLQDGTGREAEYIADMKAKCTDIDLCVFCVSISTTRFTSDSKEVKALEKLTDAFGHSLWDHAVIALTYANELEMINDDMMLARHKEDKEELSKLFKYKIAEWVDKIKATLNDVVKVSPHCSEALPIIPTGFRDPSSLPDRDHWLSSFWFAALRAMHKKAQPAMVMINYNRLVESPECVSAKEEEKFLEDQSLIFSERGFEIGGKVGSPALGWMVGEEMGQIFSSGLRARVLLEQYVIEQSIQQSKEEQQNQEDVADEHVLQSLCSGTDTKG